MGNNKALKYIISILVIVVFALGGFYFGKRTAETENMASEPKTIEKELEKKEVTTLQGAYTNSEDENERDLFFFRNDGTFRYAKFDGYVYVGNYKVEDNTITFRTTVVFNSNGCYFKDGAKVVTEINPLVYTETTATIEDGKLLITWPGHDAPEEFMVETITEDEEDLKTYTINPTDGTYSDCTNKDKI